MTTTTPWTRHWLRIRRPLPFDIWSQKGMATNITYKLFFPSQHSILFLFAGKVMLFFHIFQTFANIFPIFTKDLEYLNLT